jgi:hypothetical protein
VGKITPAQQVKYLKAEFADEFADEPEPRAVIWHYDSAQTKCGCVTHAHTSTRIECAVVLMRPWGQDRTRAKCLKCKTTWEQLRDRSGAVFMWKNGRGFFFSNG